MEKAVTAYPSCNVTELSLPDFAEKWLCYLQSDQIAMNGTRCDLKCIDGYQSLVGK